MIALVAMGVYSSIKNPANRPVYLPEGFLPVDEKQTVIDSYGKSYYARIFKQFDPNLKVEFVCIPKKQPELEPGVADPETFYIMVNKVPVALFQEFADKFSIGGAWKKTEYKNEPELPALNVTVTEAHEFADKMLGGKLPTIVEWDKAAGRYSGEEGREGPFTGHWEKVGSISVAIARKFEEGPMPIGQATNDESPYGCRDMAGNGREWTRNVQEKDAGFVPILNPTKDHHVVTRSRGYSDEVPLTFEFLKSGGGESQPYLTRSMEVGFRAVIEMLQVSK